MAERFAFACFLFQPSISSVASAMETAAAMFPDRIGQPVEAMVLDIQTADIRAEPWRSEARLLGRLPTPTEIFFAYYATFRSNSDRVCLSFQQSGAATLTISLEDMAISDQVDEITDTCFRLRDWGLGVASDCIVAAGGEIGLDPELGTPLRALSALMNDQSLASWIAWDAVQASGGYSGFGFVRCAGRTCVLRRG